MSPVNTFPISNTPFDDTFKTILERMPFLLIPFINEVFGTDYRFDSKEIQKKKLFLFLPFYFMRYEIEFHEEHTDREELLKRLDHDFQVIEEYMYQAFHGTDRMYCYTLLNELISRILDVIIPSEGSLRKEVDKIMGGHSIATPTTIALDQGYAEGHRDGIQQGTVTTIIDFIKDGLISIRQGAEKLQISEEEMRKLL